MARLWFWSTEIAILFPHGSLSSAQNPTIYISKPKSPSRCVLLLCSTFPHMVSPLFWNLQWTRPMSSFFLSCRKVLHIHPMVSPASSLCQNVSKTTGRCIMWCSRQKGCYMTWRGMCLVKHQKKYTWSPLCLSSFCSKLYYMYIKVNKKQPCVVLLWAKLYTLIYTFSSKALFERPMAHYMSLFFPVEKELEYSLWPLQPPFHFNKY
jgi:hypothetical protein